MLDATRALPALADLTPLQKAFFGYLASYDGTTRRLYEYQLQRWFEWCTSQGVDPLRAERFHVAMYVRYLTEVRGLRGSTVNSCFTPIKGLYGWAVVEELIDRDPSLHVRLPKVDYTKKHPLERDELRAIRKAGKEIGGRHWALTELLIAHALRISETTGLLIENCQDTEAGHRVMKFVRKGGKWATLPLPAPVVAAIEDAAGARTTGPVLVAIDGLPLHRSSATGLLNTVVRRSGVARSVNPHLIRASVITYGLEDGLSIREAQWLAGHQDPRTTSRHYDLGHLKHDRHPVHVLSARLTAA